MSESSVTREELKRHKLGASAVGCIICGFTALLLPAALVTESNSALYAYQKEHRLMTLLVGLFLLLTGIVLGVLGWVLIFRRRVGLEELKQVMREPHPSLLSGWLERIVVWGYRLGR